MELPNSSAGDFGSRMRHIREQRGVSLRQIAQTTKLSVSALEALERNDISRLPGGIFSRAFVRSYASEVGLDPETAVQEFMAQFPEHTPVEAQSAPADAPDREAIESDQRMATTFLWLIGLSGITVVLVAFYF